MTNALEQYYPEVYEKNEYSVKEIMRKSNVSRKTFDRFKLKYKEFYEEQITRTNEKGATLYKPMILALNIGVKRYQEKGLKGKNIEEKIEKDFNIKFGEIMKKALFNQSIQTKKQNGKGKESEVKKWGNLEILNLEKNIILKEGEISLLKETIRGKDNLFLEKERSFRIVEEKVLLLEDPLKSQENEIKNLKNESEILKNLIAEKDRKKSFWMYLSGVVFLSSIGFYYLNQIGN